MRSLRFLCLLVLGATLGVAAPNAPSELEASPRINAFGLRINEFDLDWQSGLEDYHLLVASSEERLAADRGDIWDSGWRSRNGDVPVRSMGAAIADGATVWWKVRNRDAVGTSGPWSEAVRIKVPDNAGSKAAIRSRPTRVGGETRFEAGKLGQALTLNDRATVTVVDYAALRTPTTTIAAWVKPSRTRDKWQCLYRKEDNARRLLAIGKEGPFWGLWSGFVIDGKYVEFGAPMDRDTLRDGAWHHLAASFDGAFIRLFLDGKQIGERAAAGRLTDGDETDACIGSFNLDGERYHGGLDDLRIYAKSLDPKAVALLAAGKIEVENEALAARWTFDGTVENNATYQPKAPARNRIVLLGGTVASNMEAEGAFETAVTAHWPQHEITFRNLGWPADDVFGTARSEFGSARNTRSWKPPGAEPGHGYQELLRQLREAEPCTVIVFYGAEVIWAEGLDDFETGYRRLLDDVEQLASTLILVTPHKHTSPRSEMDHGNERLKEAGVFIRAEAKRRGHRCITPDLNWQKPFQKEIPEEAIRARQVDTLYFQSGGFHLNETGHAALASELCKALDVSFKATKETGELAELIFAKNQTHRHLIRPINKTYTHLFRRHEMGHLRQPEANAFAARIAEFERAINLAKRGAPYQLKPLPETAWRAPRAYPDHEVPRDIPKPNVADELAAFNVAAGFEVNLFAKNPMVANPINLNWDARGRAWVSTSTTYPHIKPGRVPNDRIVILEDTDGDGVADKHNVFAEGLTVPHSVMPVKGGAYVCSTTDVLFLADRDGDDLSESRHVVFAGFGNADVHHMIHGLRWTPWGDLHFTQSIYINSFLDTAFGPRRMNGSGVWRFRPETGRLEAYCTGMVNPWGLAFDDFGQSFGTDGAGGAGPHYLFPGSAHPSAVGAHRVIGGLIGGKPKNTAAEFARGRHLPDRWQGSLLANDFRANRTVRYEINEAENDSGYTAKEVETVLHSKHRSFRPVDIKMGPDGAVYVVDWYNPIIDHGEVDFHHPMRDKQHGRIWRLVHRGTPLLVPPDIHEAPVAELLDMLKSGEPDTRLRANRELAERSKINDEILDWVVRLDPDDPRAEHHRLEALWLLAARHEADAELAGALLRSTNHQVRAAAVRMVRRWPEIASEPIDRLAAIALAVEDPHPRVRLEAVNAARSLGNTLGADLALRALAHPTDNNLNFALELTVRAMKDQWLPALESGRELFDGVPDRLTYALKEVNDPRAATRLLGIVREKKLEGDEREQAVRTVASIGSVDDLQALLAIAQDDPGLLHHVAAGALRQSAQPGETSILLTFLEPDRPLTHRIAAARLAGHWKSREAAGPILNLVRSSRSKNDGSLDLCAALRSLGRSNDLRELVKNGPEHVQPLACAALAPDAPELAADLLAQGADARLLVQAYLDQTQGPAQLTKALADKKLGPATAREAIRVAQRTGRDLKEFERVLRKAAGLPEPVKLDFDRAQLIAKAKQSGSTIRGRELFFSDPNLVCSACHIVDGKGGRLGPDLSTVGSYMTPASLLDSLLNPSAAIKQGYETVVVEKKDGSIVSGLLQRKTDDAVLLRDHLGQRVTSIPNDQVKELDASAVSLMPPGLTRHLDESELADLMKYLMSLGSRGTGEKESSP